MFYIKIFIYKNFTVLYIIIIFLLFYMLNSNPNSKWKKISLSNKFSSTFSINNDLQKLEKIE